MAEWHVGWKAGVISWAGRKSVDVLCELTEEAAIWRSLRSRSLRNRDFISSTRELGGRPKGTFHGNYGKGCSIPERRAMN